MQAGRRHCKEIIADLNKSAASLRIGVLNLNFIAANIQVFLIIWWWMAMLGLLASVRLLYRYH